MAVRIVVAVTVIGTVIVLSVFGQFVLWLLKSGLWWAYGLTIVGIFAFAYVVSTPDERTQWRALYAWPFKALGAWLSRKP